MRTLIVLLLIGTVRSGLAQTTPSLSIDRSTIELGDACTLRWSSSSPAAFLSGIGSVPSSGSVVVRPESTSVYVKRLIEIKTTNGSARTLFFLTRNEWGMASERPADWRIYRAHLFAKGPRIFTITPPLESTVKLSPETWRASF